MSRQRHHEFPTAWLARIAALAGWSLFMAAPVFAAEPAAEADRFDILEYQVRGNSVLPRDRIEEAVYAYMGEKKTIADVEQARAALEKAYQSAGYLTVFVNLPEQQVENGVVRLEVAEGKVDRLKVTGSRYYALGAIKARAPELAEGKVPDFNEVQKELADLNRSGGRRVTPVLRAGRVPGTVEAELKVDDQLPLHASVEVNDRYSRDTSHTRLSAALHYDNLWQAGHTLNLNLQTAPENLDESKVLVASYVAPLASGNILAAYAVASDTDVTTVGGINSLGKGTILGLRYILPLPSRRGEIHSLSLGADYKDYDDTISFQGEDETQPIAYLPFTVGYDLTVAAGHWQTQLGLSAVFGVRGLGSDEAEFAAKRTGARTDFSYFKLDLKQGYRFDNGASLIGRLAAQYAGAPLISNEQMAAGGADTVRGYPESAALGDRGWRLGLEAQSPSLAGQWAPWLNELHFLAFAEGARLYYLEPGVGQEDSFNLASAGLGLRLRAGKHYSGALDFTRALKAAGGVEDGDYRIHFRLGAEW